MTTSARKFALPSGALSLVVAVVTGSPAMAVETPPDPAPPEVRPFWTAHGVPEATQDALADKMATTGTIDALSGRFADATATTTDTGTMVETTYTFADGSIAVLAGDEPVPQAANSGAVSPMDIFYGNCTMTSGAGWVHYDRCDAELTAGHVNLKFKVSWEKHSSGPAKMTWSGGSKAVCCYGTCTDPVRALWRPTSSVNHEAVVKYRTVYTAYGNASQYSQYLGFWVTSTGAYSFTTS